MSFVWRTISIMYTETKAIEVDEEEEEEKEQSIKLALRQPWT